MRPASVSLTVSGQGRVVCVMLNGGTQVLIAEHSLVVR